MLEKVCYLPQNKAELILPEDTYAIISITTPGETANLSDQWKHRLNLQFHDLDQPNPLYSLFNKDMAKQILEFVENVKDEIDTLVVHCHAGISRSASIAKIIAEKYDLPFNHKYSLYNKHVYSVSRTVFFF